jgi:hypothetical protein
MCETSHYQKTRLNLRGMAEKNVTDIPTIALQKFKAPLHTPPAEIAADFIARPEGSQLLVICNGRDHDFPHMGQ